MVEGPKIGFWRGCKHHVLLQQFTLTLVYSTGLGRGERMPGWWCWSPGTATQWNSCWEHVSWSQWLPRPWGRCQWSGCPRRHDRTSPHSAGGWSPTCRRRRWCSSSRCPCARLRNPRSAAAECSSLNNQAYIAWFISEMIELFGFGFKSFSRISNIQIRIRQFLSPNIIQIFESFSLNLEYLKHIFPLNLEYKLGIFRCPGDLLIPFVGTNWQDLCLDVTVTLYLYELFGYTFSIPAFCFLFSTLCSNITKLFE